jgi:hypothetical protein
VEGRGWVLGFRGLELDVDAAILRVRRFVRALGIECAARGDRHLRLADAEATEVCAHRARAPRAQTEVVLLGAARIGASDQIDDAAFERAGREARRDLIEDRAVFGRELVFVVIEFRVALRRRGFDAAGGDDVGGDGERRRDLLVTRDVRRRLAS